MIDHDESPGLIENLRREIKKYKDGKLEESDEEIMENPFENKKEKKDIPLV